MLINLTCHRPAGHGQDHTIQPSGRVAGYALSRAARGAGIPVPVHGADQFGAVEGLPEQPEPGTLFIVSLAVGQALVAAGHPLASQCVRPGTGPNDGAIREGGQIVAVTRLVRVA